MKRFAWCLILAVLPAPAPAADWGIGLSAGTWQVRETDEFVRTLFEGEPDGFALGFEVSRSLSRHTALVASLDFAQGASVNGIRPGRGTDFVVRESEWLRSASLLIGVKLQGPPEWRVSPYLQLTAGPTLVRQRLREVRFRDVYTPIDRDDWELTLQPAAGVEIRAGRVTLAAEALWQEFANKTTLAQLRTPYDLDRWAVRGRIAFRLGR
jgi:hypothetical protein